MAQKDILTDSEILSHYIKMGEVVSEMFRPHLEVIIHDLRFPEHSIILQEDRWGAVHPILVIKK